VHSSSANDIDHLMQKYGLCHISSSRTSRSPKMVYLNCIQDFSYASSCQLSKGEEAMQIFIVNTLDADQEQVAQFLMQSPRLVLQTVDDVKNTITALLDNGLT